MTIGLNNGAKKNDDTFSKKEKEMSDLTWMFVIGGLLALAIFGFVSVSSQRNKKTKLREMVDSQDGFQSSHFLVKIPLKVPIPAGIAIDDQSNQICLITGVSLRFMGFSDIIESEVLAGGKTITKTSRESQFAGAAIGGLLLGGIGAVVGSLTGKQTTAMDVKDVCLKIIVNDTSNPIHIIDFIELTNTGGTPPNVALQEAQQWHDLLTVIIKKAEQEAESRPKVVPPSDQVSPADQIRQLAELHSAGALSDEEFTTAKRKIIS